MLRVAAMNYGLGDHFLLPLRFIRSHADPGVVGRLSMTSPV
jgi:hypothetical protein